MFLPPKMKLDPFVIHLRQALALGHGQVFMMFAHLHLG